MLYHCVLRCPLGTLAVNRSRRSFPTHPDYRATLSPRPRFPSAPFRKWPLIRRWLDLPTWLKCVVLLAIAWFVGDERGVIAQQSWGDGIVALAKLLEFGCIVRLGFDAVQYLCAVLNAKHHWDTIQALPEEQVATYVSQVRLREFLEMSPEERARRYPEEVRKAEALAASTSPEGMTALLRWHAEKDSGKANQN